MRTYMEHIYDMLIIGGGPGGCTAAMYAARAGLDVLLFEKMMPGGQMARSHAIDNYPGFEDGIDGFTLGEKMRAGAERSGAEILMTEVLSAELKGEIKTIRTPDGSYSGRTVVIASGADPKKLGIPGEDGYLGRGIHTCASCDGMFYRGKTVIVAGGGNTAAGDALLLSRTAQRVIVVHHHDRLSAEKCLRDSLHAASNVEFRPSSTISRITERNGSLNGAVLRNTDTGEECTVSCGGIFVCIGRTPATALFRGQTELDGNGYIAADESTCTSLPGVFAAGDVRTKSVRQIVTAVSDGAAAVHSAEAYLASSKLSSVPQIQR